MLQVRMLSGEAVTSMPVAEIQDVKALKQRLTQLHGFPPRFRQRVLFHGENLTDDVTLDSPMYLDLLLLTFADVSQRQVDKLAAAALQGSLSEVGSLETVDAHGPTRKKSFCFEAVSTLSSQPFFALPVLSPACPISRGTR